MLREERGELGEKRGEIACCVSEPPDRVRTYVQVGWIFGDLARVVVVSIASHIGVDPDNRIEYVGPFRDRGSLATPFVGYIPP